MILKYLMESTLASDIRLMIDEYDEQVGWEKKTYIQNVI